MKTLVLYQSNTGCTKAYAEAIAQGIHGDVMPLKKFKAYKKIRENYDAVVFGGWVMGNTIQGIDKFLTHWDEMEGMVVLVFAVGMGIPTDESRKILISQNVLDLYHLRFYQFRGSFDYAKLKFPYNLYMNMFMKRIEQDPSMSENSADLLQLKERPLYFNDTEKVEKILTVLRTEAAKMEVTKA